MLSIWGRGRENKIKRGHFLFEEGKRKVGNIFSIRGEEKKRKGGSYFLFEEGVKKRGYVFNFGKRKEEERVIFYEREEKGDRNTLLGEGKGKVTFYIWNLGKGKGRDDLY